MMRATLHMLLTVTMLVTSIGAASARGAAPAVDHVVICGGQGVSVLYLDAEGEPTHPPHLCPDCILHLVAPLPGGAALAPMRVAPVAAVLPVGTSQDVQPHLSPITSRGPPIVLI